MQARLDLEKKETGLEMKKLLGAVVAVVCLSSFAETEFWSIGSFNVLANAAAEKNRISGITGLSVQIATFTVGDVSTYRLVIEKDSYPMEQRQKIMDAGITPWTLSTDNQHLSVTEEGSEEIADGLDYFLVVGGFRQEILANMLLSRFESDGLDSLQIEEATVASAPWYRVLHGPFDAPFDTVLSNLRARGVADVWWVKREPEMAVEKDVAIEPSIALKTPMTESPPLLASQLVNKSPLVHEISLSKPKLNPPNPSESYFDYCIKKANALERTVYCEDGSFSGLAIAEKNRGGRSEGKTSMSSGAKALAEFCAMRASQEEREKYCID